MEDWLQQEEQDIQNMLEMQELDYMENGMKLWLKEDVDFKELEKYDFYHDPVNCEDKRDTYYGDNNYFYQSNKYFRITINMHTRQIIIICLPKSHIEYLTELKPLYDIIKAGLVRGYFD